MKNVETVSDSSLALESPHKDPNKLGPFVWLFDLGGIALVSTAFYVGQDAWKNWLSSPDRRLFSVCLILGILIALARSNWQGVQSKSRIWATRISFAVASILICSGVALSNPLWSGIACSVSVSAWCMGRIRGESVLQSLFVGSMLAVPFAIESMASRGDFVQLESFAVDMTSLLSETVSEPHARENQTILFRKGTADHFSCIGTWDSVVGLIGVSLFIILAFRRNLLTSICVLPLTAVVWVAVRCVAWVTISYLANRYGTWYPWSINLELGLFLSGVVLVVSLDQFFATVFKPIPVEFFNPESPLCAFIWNWLCGLPRLVFRVPKQNKISLRWRKRLHLAGKKSSFRTDLKWMRIELFDLLIHPIGAIGSVIDAVRGWRYSRSWKIFFYNLPSFLLLATLFIAIAFSASNRNEKQSQFVLEESLKLCSTESLEAACNQQLESNFCNSIGAIPILKETDSRVSESTKSQVEFQCKRILATDENNQLAKYRLGMVYALNDHVEGAIREVSEACKLADFPRADAWLAKAIISLKATGSATPMPDLLVHLENAQKWPAIDFRLPFYYSRLLEERGQGSKAIFIANQAVTANPDWIIELAKLYARIGDKEGLARTANRAEVYFFAKMNLENEKESDRLAVSDARLLTNRPAEAAEVLEEGLRQNPDAKNIRRQLSKIQLLNYQNSIRINENGGIDLDYTLLRKAAETDPQNPDVSVELAKLIPYSAYREKPPEDLLDILKNQIELGITSVPTLLLVGEGFYSRGKFASAQKYWEMALVKEPENFTVLNNLASCLVAISADNAERALELVVKANSILPRNADILDTWGDVLLAANRPQEAINKLEMAIRIDNSRMQTRKKLVTAFQAAGMKSMEEAQLMAIHAMEQAEARIKLEKETLDREKRDREKREKEKLEAKLRTDEKTD